MSAVPCHSPARRRLVSKVDVQSTKKSRAVADFGIWTFRLRTESACERFFFRSLIPLTVAEFKSASFGYDFNFAPGAVCGGPRRMVGQRILAPHTFSQSIHD